MLVLFLRVCMGDCVEGPVVWLGLGFADRERQAPVRVDAQADRVAAVGDSRVSKISLSTTPSGSPTTWS